MYIVEGSLCLLQCCLSAVCDCCCYLSLSRSFLCLPISLLLLVLMSRSDAPSVVWRGGSGAVDGGEYILSFFTVIIAIFYLESFPVVI